MNLPTFETSHEITFQKSIQKLHMTEITCHMKLADMTIHICNATCYVTSQAMHLKDLAMHASYRPNNLTN